MVEMKILQTRDDWLKNRMGGIGGSEISAVIGANPYMDNVTLWEYKTGRKVPEDISDKPFVEYGTKAEHYLRELFKLDFPQYQVEYVENNSFTNNKYPWAKASLDGWLTESETGRQGIWECKTTEILRSMQKEKWQNQIPMNYYCQVLFYMAVCEKDFTVLKAQLKTVFDKIPYLQTKHYIIECEKVQGDIDYLMQEGEKFWEYVLADKQPPLVLPKI